MGEKQKVTNGSSKGSSNGSSNGVSKGSSNGSSKGSSNGHIGEEMGQGEIAEEWKPVCDMSASRAGGRGRRI